MPFASSRNESSGGLIPGRWQAGKILVVDDQSANRDLLREFLEGCGWEVREAVDGRAGLDAALEWMPDVVLLDMQMPRMNGLELTRALREQMPPRLGVVAITAGVFAEPAKSMVWAPFATGFALAQNRMSCGLAIRLGPGDAWRARDSPGGAPPGMLARQVVVKQGDRKCFLKKVVLNR